MSQILDFLTKWWPMLLAIGGFTTLANRISDKLIAPRWPRAGAVISAICVDYWLVIREIASFFGLPTEASAKSATIRAAKNVAKGAMVLLALSVASCTPAEIQSAVQVAKDVSEIARVLCLLDQSKIRGARADVVQDACQTVGQLAPYLDQAKQLQSAPRAMAVCK